MRVLVCKDYDGMSKKAAEMIAAQIVLKPNSILGLATGSTPVGMYRDLVKKYNDNIVDFSDVMSFNLDEYYKLPISNDQSYDYFMKENLFNHVNLGIGRNAHIGFNEPDTKFAKRTHVVELTESTIEANARFFKSREDVPKKAVSMGIGSILKSKKILLLASGEEKADAVYNTVYGDITPEVPGSILQLHKDTIVIVDEAAASKLNPKDYKLV
ncbi:MAG: glucosamine-6-phosphate deaminase [Clostridioides difficile]|nr:glucosamine-6-phosphate deaminase [Clostridioides difficile]